MPRIGHGPGPIWDKAHRSRDQKEAISVVNLSKSYKTSRRVEQILDKGFSFVPHNSKRPIFLDFDDFRIRARRFLPYLDKDISGTPPGRPDFTKPHPEFADFEVFISELETFYKDIRNHAPEILPQNFSKAEWTELKSLKANRNIVIKPADKGGNVVIMDREDYVRMGENFLSDPAKYEVIQGPLCEDNIIAYRELLHRNRMVGNISEGLEKELLIEEDFRQPVIYFLPKIHKEFDQIPKGRPIQSACGAEGHKIATFIEGRIRHVVDNLPHIVWNSLQFIERLQPVRTAMRNNPQMLQDMVILTADIDSLYPSMPIQETIDVLTRAIVANPGRIVAPAEFMELVSHQLFHNCMEFNNVWYRQVSGIAMGWAPAPHVANIFLGGFDEAIMKEEPILSVRYLDDLMVICKDREQADRIVRVANSWNPAIKLTDERSQEKGIFLDVLLYRSDNELHHRIYVKPTASRSLLHALSYHPPHSLEAVITSSYLRYFRLSSEDCEALREIEVLNKVLIAEGGHSERELKRLFLKVRRSVDQSLVEEPLNNESPELILKAEWDPRTVDVVRELLCRYVTFRMSSATYRRLLPSTFMTCWMSDDNLRHRLTRARLPDV
jgi:hypothetical protein